MTLNDYQTAAYKTALYREQIANHYNLDTRSDDDVKILDAFCADYVVIGFVRGVGEFIANPSIGEAGGILWYAAAIATEFDVLFSAALDLDIINATFDDIKSIISIGHEQSPLLDAAQVALSTQNQWKKMLRDGKRFNPIPDVNWILSYLVSYLDYEVSFTLEQAAIYNLEQLASRAERGKIQGDGDDR